MQNRICQHEGASESEEGLRELYSEALQADREMKELIRKMPAFLRDEHEDHENMPVYIKQQRAVLNLGFAHKVCSLPRYVHVGLSILTNSSSILSIAISRFLACEIHSSRTQR